MIEAIILKEEPTIEFQLLENGFNLIDQETQENSGFYSYQNVQSVELNKLWFPTLAKWLRAITWILNGVPYFPDGESYKKASMYIYYKDTKFGIWLTDSYMTRKAKSLKKVLDKKIA